MAAGYARALLDEVQEEGLDELLLTLHILRPLAPSGLPALDALLRSSLSPPRHRPPLIEVAGLAPCSGKTQLLYLVSARHLASGAMVIWLDLSGRFSAARMRTILQGSAPAEHPASQGRPAPPPAAGPPASEAPCLAHLHVHRPRSLAALLATLRDLPDALLAPAFQAAHPSSAHRPVAALVVSDLHAVHPELRRAAALHHAEHPASPPHRHVAASYAALLAAVRGAQAGLGCAAFVSAGGAPERARGAVGVGVAPREGEGGLGGGRSEGGLAWEGGLDARVVVGRAGAEGRAARFEGVVYGGAAKGGRFGFTVGARGVEPDGEG